MSCLSYVLDLSKLGALLHKIHSKVLLVILGAMVPRLNMCSSIMPLSRTTHQIWDNLLFSQRNKATKKAVEVNVGMRRGGSQNFKKGGLHNVRGSLKRGG